MGDSDDSYDFSRLDAFMAKLNDGHHLVIGNRFAGGIVAAHPPRLPRWNPVPTGSDQQYRGLDAVSARVAWVGGSAGEVRRTLDGGRSWQVVSPLYTTFDGGRKAD